VIELELVLPQVAIDVVVGVDPREVDPGPIAGARVGRALDVDADLREREFVTARQHIALDDRETERTDRGDDRIGLGPCGEVDEERPGVDAQLDLEIGLWGSGLGFGR
jgi:hypothetical protein